MNIAPTSARDMPPLIPFRMSKGGVGKTTISTNVGTCFAYLDTERC
jgi:cellulose biosynthesis protein BcsQ